MISEAPQTGDGMPGRCRGQGSGPSAGHRIGDITEACRGRAYLSESARLASFVLVDFMLVDFVRSRRRRVR